MADTRVAMLGIIVDNNKNVEQVNNLLHEYGNYIIGRIGIPYRERGVSIIGIVLDAPQNEISTLSGKIGRLDGINVKVTYSNI